jgi:DNA-binding sugar fermentation-stimulating protein
MAVHIQTGNMLDVIVDGKSLGLKQRDSDHRKYEVIWLPKPEGLRDVLTAEINRLNPASTPSEAAQQAAREIALSLSASELSWATHRARNPQDAYLTESGIGDGVLERIAEIISHYCGTGEMK